MNSTIKKKNLMQRQPSYVSVKQRIVGFFTATILLLQICLPTVASAARLLTNESIASAMASPSFQRSNSNAYLYQQASFDDAAYIGSQNITTFRERLVAAKSNLGKPTFIPIASDITIFVPTYPTGKLLGDVYVQNRYIRQQVFELLGRHLIYANRTDSIGISETAQINALYENAYAYAQKNPSKNFGDNLDAGALSHDTNFKDMVWPEIRTINNERVVVPVLYLTDETVRENKVTRTRTELLGDNVNSGSISLNNAELTLGARTIVKTAGNLTADKNSLIESGGDINLVVGGTLNLIGSTITGEKNVTILANEVNVKSVLVPFQDRYGSGTKLGNISSINSTAGNISLNSTGNVTFEGSTATASNGSLTINAGGNISILPLFATYQGSYREGDWHVNASSLDVIGSRLSAQEKISLISGGAINITASDLISAQGGIELLAQQGIYVVDELTQEQIQKIDRKGKTKGQSSEFRTEAVRSILRAGKGVVLDTEFGDVELKATNISSTSGTQVTAKNGTVHLLMTKELEEFHLQTVTKSTWTIKTRTVDVIHENNIQNAIVGGLQVQAKYGINVEYTGKEGATLKEQIEEYRNMPEMKWMADLYDQGVVAGGQSVNWEAMEEIHKELKKTKRNLSPAAMAIVAICVAVAMGPAGAGWLGSGSGAIGAATFNGTVIVNAAAMQAGALTLATQAAQSLASGNNLRETISAFDSNENLKSLAISMATAGAMQHTDIDFFTTAAESKNLAVSLAGQAGQAVVNSTVSAGISVAINGGNTKDFEKAFVQSLAMSAVNKIGEKMANKIGGLASGPTPKIGEAMRYIAHAGLGCALGVASSKVGDPDADVGVACGSGAGGAVIGEFIAQEYTEDKLNPKQKELLDLLKAEGFYDVDLSSMSLAEQAAYGERFKNAQISPETLFRMQAIGVDFAKLGAGLAAFAAGGDVNIAANAGENAAKNNMLFLIPIAIALIKMADLALQAKELYDIYAVFEKEGEAAGQDALRKYLEGKLEEKVIESLLPGVKSGKAILEVLTEKGIIDRDNVEKIAKWIEDKKSLTTIVGNDFPGKKPIEVPAGSKGDWDKRINGGLEPNAVYKLDNGHTYVTDESGRVMNVGGNLGGIKLDRNTYQQRCVGQSECSTGYDGGHLIASHLGGAGDKINLIPMTRDLNRVDYRAMERELGAALDAGSSVNIKIDVVYSNSGTVTPSHFYVTSWVDGIEKNWKFTQ